MGINTVAAWVFQAPMESSCNRVACVGVTVGHTNPLWPLAS